MTTIQLYGFHASIYPCCGLDSDKLVSVKPTISPNIRVPLI